MAVKIKTKLSLKKQLQGARSNSSRLIKKQIVEDILAEYNKGLSPVKGFNRYKAYRASTAKKKGRKFPVNLQESSQLHKALSAVQKGKKKIEISFKGARNDKIASYHQFGTANMDARPMLPSRGQEFKKKITDKIIKTINKALKKFLK